MALIPDSAKTSVQPREREEDRDPSPLKASRQPKRSVIRQWPKRKHLTVLRKKHPNEDDQRVAETRRKVQLRKVQRGRPAAMRKLKMRSESKNPRV
jgi:hypothetical protein